VTEHTPEGPIIVRPSRRRDRTRTAALVLLATVAAFAALYFGREVFIPLSLALVFTALLRPVVRALERLKIPTALAATMVVLTALAALAGAAMAVAAPVQGWAQHAPERMHRAQQKLRRLVHVVDPVADAVNGVTGGGSSNDQQKQGGSSNGNGTSPNPGVPSVGAKLFGMTTSLLAGFVEVLLLTWFLLASGDLFLRKLVYVLPVLSEKKRALEVVHETEAVVSRYMLVSLLINIGQGGLVALMMWAIGMPTPVLWGMMTVLVEFVPYLGATFMILVLTLVGLATFDTAVQALMAPGGYLLITTLQNNLVSPVAYGRRLKLNPVAVLLSVMVWFGLWGVPGAFLAVPIVATAKVLCDRVPGLMAVGEFLGD
jgi:predicted PurR-regulated permease PerM